MNNLAVELGELGRKKEAYEMIKKAFELCQKVLGENHPDTLHSMHNLAVELSGFGRKKEAYETIKKAFELHKQILGEKHPRTLHLQRAY